MNVFKTGQSVECVDDSGIDMLTEGNVYKILKVDGDRLYFDTSDTIRWYRSCRFKPADSKKDADVFKLTVSSDKAIQWHRVYEEAMEDGSDFATVEFSDGRGIIIMVRGELLNKAYRIEGGVDYLRRLHGCGVFYNQANDPSVVTYDELKEVVAILKHVKHAPYAPQYRGQVTIKVKGVSL